MRYKSLDSDIEVNMRISQGYPEAGRSYAYDLDVCLACFKTQIMDKVKNYTKTETVF